jgi:hypothetical protein
MNDDEKAPFLDAAWRLVRDLNDWAAEKSDSGTPVSERERALIGETRAKLAELRKVLASMAANV